MSKHTARANMQNPRSEIASEFPQWGHDKKPKGLGTPIIIETFLSIMILLLEESWPNSNTPLKVLDGAKNIIEYPCNL